MHLPVSDFAGNAALYITIFQLKCKPEDTYPKRGYNGEKFLKNPEVPFKYQHNVFCTISRRHDRIQFAHWGQRMCVTIVSQQLHKPDVAMHQHHSKSHGHKNILFELKAAENRWRDLPVTPRCCLHTCSSWEMQSDLSIRK